MAKVSKSSTDPRVVRTRAMLRTAFFALLEEQPFAAISVLAITERAGVNPATFYLHYDDKWALLGSVTDELRAALDAQLQLAATQQRGHDLSWVAALDLTIFTHIAQYRDFYRLMLGKHGDPLVRYQLEQQIRNIARQVIAQLPESYESIDVPDALVEYFYGGAYLAVIQWWLGSSEPITPQQLARWMENMWNASASAEFAALFAPPGDGVRG